MSRDGKSTFRPAEPAFGRPSSVVGVDCGLAHAGFAHVSRVDPDAARVAHVDEGFPFALCDGSHRPCSGVFTSEADGDETVAESTAHRTHDLLRWLQARLSCAVAGGAELVAAERAEQVRDASAASKYAAGHAALVCACATLSPRPILQRAGCGCPRYLPARRVKRAVAGCDVATKRVVERAARRLVAGAAEGLDGMRRGRRSAECEHFADACAVAACALGYWEKPVLVTEAKGELAEVFMKAMRVVDRQLLTAAFDVWSETPPDANERLDGRAVVYVGKPSLLGLPRGRELEWVQVGDRGCAYMAAVLPDPGDARWWKSAKNEARARTFLRAAARVT